MKMLTTPRMERCIGCHNCSFACARLVNKISPGTLLGFGSRHPEGCPRVSSRGNFWPATRLPAPSHARQVPIHNGRR